MREKGAIERVASRNQGNRSKNKVLKEKILREIWTLY